MIFKEPIFFLGLLILPLLIWNYFYRDRKIKAALKFSSIGILKNLPSSGYVYLRHVLFALRLACLVCLIIALARPQSSKKDSLIKSQGIDIMLSLDISGSMRGEDMKPSHRLGAAKAVMNDFIQKRFNDRLGLVVYGQEAFLQCPLTLDHGVLAGILKKVDFLPDIENGTAIGMAVSTAVAHLKDSEAKSKVIVLLTDGDNNAGEIDPETAAKLANTYEIKIYTVGVGKPGLSRVPITFDDPLRGKIKHMIANHMNEELLKKMAEFSQGKYFNADNTRELTHVYETIDQLEKTEISSAQYLEYHELFPWLLWTSLLFLLLEMILSHTRFRQLP